MAGMALEYVFERVTGTPKARLLALCIAHHVSVETGTAFPSQQRLSKISGLAPRTIRNAITELEEQGIVRRKKRRNSQGERTSDLFELVGYLDWQNASRKLARTISSEPPPSHRQILPLDEMTEITSGKNCTYHRQELPPNKVLEQDKPSSLRSEEPSAKAAGSDSANAVFWREALSHLKTIHTDSSEKQLRTLIGKWLKRAGGDVQGLSVILAGAQKAGTMDVISYMTKAVNEKYEAPQSPDQFSEQKWRTIRNLIVEGSNWDSSLGPPPGSKGCRMPAHLITPELEQTLR